MDWSRAIAVDGEHFVVPDSSQGDRWWHLTKGTGSRMQRVDDFFFDASAFHNEAARGAAAVAAAEEHLRLPGPAHRQACKAREEYHRQRIETANRVMAEAADLGDRQRESNAKTAADASIERLRELGSLNWA